MRIINLDERNSSFYTGTAHIIAINSFFKQKPTTIGALNVFIKKKWSFKPYGVNDTAAFNALILTPDIGIDKALVAEILVSVGDQIHENDSVLLLESDKASVEVASSATGIVEAILVKLGDEVTEGITLIKLETTKQANSITRVLQLLPTY